MRPVHSVSQPGPTPDDEPDSEPTNVESIARPVTPPLPRTLRCRVCLTNLGAIVAGRALFAADRAARLLAPSRVPR